MPSAAGGTPAGQPPGRQRYITSALLPTHCQSIWPTTHDRWPTT